MDGTQRFLFLFQFITNFYFFSSFDERDRFPLNLKGLSCWPGNSGFGGVALELKGLSLLSRTGR